MPKHHKRRDENAPIVPSAKLADQSNQANQASPDNPAEGLTLTVHLGPAGVAQFQKFLGEQQIAHAEAECMFPGYEFAIGHWPPVDFWEVEVKVGPAFVVIDDATVRLEKTITPPR